jgi:hypothetical protein
MLGPMGDRARLLHVGEDPAITRLVSHGPATNPDQAPGGIRLRYAKAAVRAPADGEPARLGLLGLAVAV